MWILMLLAQKPWKGITAHLLMRALWIGPKQSDFQHWFQVATGKWDCAISAICGSDNGAKYVPTLG
jgi:hypothetical protein